MMLVIDVGNTTIHFGLYRGPKLLAQWRMATVPTATSDELGLQMRQFIEAEGYKTAAVKSVAVCSVVPPLDHMIKEALERWLDRSPYVVDPMRSPTLPNKYRFPTEVGADRLANSVSGLERYGAPLIIVDFGTATTFDVISPEGEYLGGAIAPGIELSVSALFTKAARLPRVDLVPPANVIGQTTMDSMRAGIIHGYAGLVDRLNRLIRAELGRADCPVVATGGLAGTITPYTETIGAIDDALTLEGIRLIARRASGQKRSD